MIERRISPRNKCPISLTYRVLNDKEYRELMENFYDKRSRIVLYDQLDFKNQMVSLRLQNLDNELTPILTAINDQLKSLTQTLSMNFDVLYHQVNSDVTINMGGMSFQTVENLAAGKVIELQLMLSPEIPRLLIVAEVVRSEQNAESKEITTAISFTYTAPEDKAILMEFVTQQEKEGRSDQDNTTG